MKSDLAAWALLAALAAPAALAVGGERHVFAWPPTRYESGELVLWRDVAGADPLRVRVRARGLDTVVDLPSSEAFRVPLPPGARCAPGLDACAIEAARVAGTGSFSALLQSPDTNGAADTLLRTAHDTVRLPPADAASTRVVVVSAPCAPPAEMPQTASFVTIVPVARAARVIAPAASCAGVVDVVVALGEALTLACGAEGDDLSGLVVEADAPFVAFSGNAVTTVPVDPGRGLSGDLLLDLAGEPEGPARFVVPPLPRGAAFAGRGDIVRVVALEAARVRVRDDRGGDATHLLAAGDVLDVDTAAAGSDAVLALDADASVAAWHVPRSRALRGMGDPAAIPLVSSARFTTADRVFVPDGYAEAIVLCVAAEPGARIVAGGATVSLQAAPGGELAWGLLSVAAPPPGGSMLEMSGDRPFGAWLVGFGGYKGFGHAAARTWARPPPERWLLRGTRADDLVPAIPASSGAHEDVAPEPLVFWRVDEPGRILTVRRCATACCLSW